MLEKDKEPKTVQEPKVKAKKKDYTILKAITLEKVYTVGSTVSVEIGSDLEKKLLTGKHINKHGVSRSN